MVMEPLPLLVIICADVCDVTLALGDPRLGWFRMLYMSARNCSRMRSRIGCHRLMAVSKEMVPGLRRSGSVRESVPKEYAGGLVKAAVLNHWFMLLPLDRFPSATRCAWQPEPWPPAKLQDAVMEI